MGLSFSSRARSLLCSCHSLVIVLGGAGAAGMRPRQLAVASHAHRAAARVGAELTLAANAKEDGGGDADQADGAEEGAHALPRLHVRLARAMPSLAVPLLAPPTAQHADAFALASQPTLSRSARTRQSRL